MGLDTCVECGNDFAVEDYDKCLDCLETEQDEYDFPNDDEIEIWGKRNLVLFTRNSFKELEGKQ